MKVDSRIKFRPMLLIMAAVSAFCLAHPAYCDYQRELTIKVVADQKLTANDDWQRTIRDELNNVAKPLANVLGISIKTVAYQTWYRDPGADLKKLAWQMIEDVDPDEADVIMGFALMPEESGRMNRRIDGMTIAYRGVLLNIYEGGKKNNFWLPYVIVHEMVHLFGGVHVNGSTIMSPHFTDEVKMELDDLNRRIIRLTRHIDFKSGYQSLDRNQLEKLSGLYQKAVHEGNRDIPTFLEIASICHQLGDMERARDAYRKIIDLDPTLVHAWIQLGFCYFEDGQPDMTIAILERSLESVSEKDLIYSKLAALYFNQGQYRKSHYNARMAQYHGATIDPQLWEALKKANVDESR